MGRNNSSWEFWAFDYIDLTPKSLEGMGMGRGNSPNSALNSDARRGAGQREDQWPQFRLVKYCNFIQTNWFWSTNCRDFCNRRLGPSPTEMGLWPKITMQMWDSTGIAFLGKQHTHVMYCVYIYVRVCNIAMYVASPMYLYICMHVYASVLHIRKLVR